MRTALILAIVAGTTSTAAAQEAMQVHYSWLEVFANSCVPATGPLAGNSVVDPGEGARIRVGVTALINGANAVGQTINYTNPVPGGVGTVRGLGTVTYDLMGDNAQPTAAGAWTWRLGAATPPFAMGITGGGFPQFDGAALFAIGGSQFVAPGGTASPINNNVQLFRGVWTPALYSERTVNWSHRLSVLMPPGQGNSILLAYGQASDFDQNGSPYTYDLLVNKQIALVNNGLNISIAPEPSSVAIFLLGALGQRGRRR